ncbi:MAG TPA: efflux RND transporter periplasmic adaptor subunit [Thermoanaerobaculia bacterium]|jgi:HlyD family secretion protein|nr:efflux RND transporter periplasmic adaptor subunit [Thermoanaerobaculia bacterium]
MMRKVIVLLLVAGAATAGWFYWHRRPAPHELVLAGSLEARTVEVGSLVGGRVARVLVDEGDRVRAGQVLIELEGDLLALQIGEQRAAISEAQANLAKATKGPRNEEVRRAEIDWQAAKTDRERFESLWKSGVIGKRDFDATAVREASTLETLRQAQRGGRSEDRAAGSAVVERLNQQLGYLERQKQELAIVAPAAGEIEALDLRPGDLINPNQAALTLLEDGQLWVRVYVPEPDLGLVRVGQELRISIDSFPDRTFRGRVVEIRDQGEYTPRNLQTLDQRSDLVFGTKIEVEPAPELKAGMTAIAKLPLPPAAAKTKR